MYVCMYINNSAHSFVKEVQFSSKTSSFDNEKKMNNHRISNILHAHFYIR
jgi:hypothetical protein